jgi:hypothetical protein
MTAFGERWPALPHEAWKATYETLHLWTQIVGKVKLALSPPENHWWHVTLLPTARGLTTGPIPWNGQEGRVFDVQFDFIDHALFIHASDGSLRTMPLVPRSVASFYGEFMECLRALGINVTINPIPSEMENPVRCDQDEKHASYDPEFSNRFWRILVETAIVFKRHRSRFIGKTSPVHFFWGSFDLALTFFSGRPAPDRAGADHMTREAYSHEVISCGFWPGSDAFPRPAFYSYAAPEPPGLASAPILPPGAGYDPRMKEFLLSYDQMRAEERPEEALLAFCRSTYEAAANLGKWDRSALER